MTEDNFIEEYRRALPDIQTVYGPNYNPLRIRENGELEGADPGDPWGILATLRLRRRLNRVD